MCNRNGNVTSCSEGRRNGDGRTRVSLKLAQQFNDPLLFGNTLNRVCLVAHQPGADKRSFWAVLPFLRLKRRSCHCPAPHDTAPVMGRLSWSDLAEASQGSSAKGIGEWGGRSAIG